MRKFSLIIAVIILLLWALPAYAQSLPDTDPPTPEVTVYRNLLETGDRLYLIYANIPYATTPTIPVTEAFIWQLIDTDNTTVLGQTVGSTWADNGLNGYGYNVYSMYFDAASALTWEALYSLKLTGTPYAFTVPPEYNYSLNVADYNSNTTQADNQADLAARILTLADDLNTRWSLTGSDKLLTETETGTALSTNGEEVFRAAINGCQALAPGAFQLVVTDITAADRTWILNYSGNLSTQYDGTWIATSKDAGGDLFSATYDLLSIIFVLGMAIGIVYLNMKITNDHWNALMDVAILLVIAPRIDLIPLSFTALICAVFAIYEGTRVKSFVA